MTRTVARWRAVARWRGGVEILLQHLGRRSLEVRCRLSRRNGELGIVFARNYGSATIEAIVPHSAAHADGSLRVGDVLCQVNTQHVFTPEGAARQLRGAQDTVTLKAFRIVEGAEGQGAASTCSSPALSCTEAAVPTGDTPAASPTLGPQAGHAALQAARHEQQHPHQQQRVHRGRPEGHSCAPS